MSEEETNAIKYLKARLYGNKGCKYIDVAQEDLRRIIKLVDIKEKSLKQSNDLITEQDEEICKINNEKCDLEFKVDKLQKELDKKDKVIDLMAFEIAENTGSCPADIYDWENKKYDNCNNCNDTYKECFIEYFYKEVEEEE